MISPSASSASGPCLYVDLAFGGKPEDLEAALGMLRYALELCVNLIDISDAYGPEVNERQGAEALLSRGLPKAPVFVPSRRHLRVATYG